jgi:hypothetical protein
MQNSSDIEHDGLNYICTVLKFFILVLLYNHSSPVHVNVFAGIEEIPVELMKAEGTF